MRRSLRRLAIAALLVTLAACSSGDKEVLRCPAIGFLNDVDSMTAFRDGTGTDLSDVLWEAEFGNITAECDFGRKGVEIPTFFEIVATRGPADTDRVANVAYFVAITDPAGEIVAKEVYEAPIPFADNRRRVGRREQIEPFIPFPEPRTDIGAFKVFIGFQLTEAQVRYNRATKR